jgi:acyl transferase domain-containing protein/acyl carrier protein
VPAPVAAPPAATPAAPATPADGAPGPEQTARTVGRIAAEVLGVPGQRLSRTRGFYELGFDSFSIVDLVNRLGAEFGVDLPAGAGLEHPSVEALTERILDEVAARPAPAPAPAPAAVQEPVAAPDAGPAPVPQPAYAVGTAAEPVAIVGMSCRLPGAPGIDAYWRLLSEGVDATGDVPADRWNAAELLDAGAPPGAPRTATGRGAFIEGIDRFDNTFFHVSAREARSMDPQQRIFLEVAWEALEDAGLDAHTLRGGRTGLFVGLNTVDYGQLLVEDPERVDLYYGTGNTFSGSAGRMSYFLGVRGPSVAVDTACASSLTAVHLGCQSLRTGESDVVVVGGANALLTPTVYMAMSAGGALAPDGRCKAFAASADGYGRGEGAGALVLKRLSQAQADGDRVHAVIRGSAVNHNGASGGLTVPSAEAQAEVIGAALAQAGVDPAEVDYVEAHGTGTPLGDPIELTALDRAIGAHRPDGRPLLVGSVKTNIAHLEAAAGVAGLIKTVLALREGEIPAHLHFAEPSPKIPWDRLRVKVTDRATPWPRGAHTPTAGVSAFGFTGTNAHVVLAQAPASPAAAPAPAPGRGGSRRPYAVAVSAADPAALDAAVRGVADLLDDPAGPAPADLAHTLGVRRTHLEHRVVATGADRAELLASLRDAPAAGTARPGEPARLAAVFGPDVAALPWQDLYDAEPAFRAALDAADGAAVEALGTSVRTGLIRRGSGGTPGPLTAPEAVAAQIALASLWADHGVRPEALAGRGLGEIAAAQVAGVLTLRDAMALAGGVPAVHPAAEPVVPLHLASRLGGDDAFGPAVAERLLDGGVELLVDAGLTGSAADVAALAADLTAVTVPGPADAGSFVRAAAALHAAGASVDWRALLAGRGTQIPLPAYPWQHRRHWIDAAAPRRPAPAPAAAPALLGAPLTPYDAPGARYYPVHRPAGDGEPAGLGAMAGLLDAAGREVTGGAVRLRDLDLGVPLVAAPALAPGAGAQILARRAAGGWTLSLVAGRHGGRDAGPVASAAVTPAGAGPETVDLDALRARLTRTVPWDGPQGVEPAAPTLGAEDGAERLASVRTSVPDAALDAAVDLLASCTPGGAERRPAAIGTLLLHGAPAAGDLLLHAVAGDEDTAGVRVLAADGTVLAELTGVRYEPAPGAETPADTALVPEDVRERTARRLHTVRWQPALLPDPPRPADAGRWLVAAATARDEAAAQGLAAALTAAGHPARALAGEVDWPAVMSGSGPWEPSAFDADAQAPSGGAPAEATAGTRPGDAPAAGVLLVAGGGEGTGGGVLPVALAAARAAAGAGAPPRLWLVTRGAQEPLGGAAPAHELAAAWGLVRVLAMEAPAGWGGCLDLPGLGARDLAAAVDVVTGGRQRGGPVEDELVLRDGTWWAPRLAPADPPPAVLPPLRFRREGWYVVAGALTAAVRPVVDRLVSAGARRLLVVRPAAPDGTGGSEAGWAEEMSLAGVDVKIAELPAPEAGADPAGLLAAVTGGEPVAGVVVAPVAPPVRPLAETGPGHLAAGAALSGLVARLEGELRGVPLDFFYVLGSAAAAWGSAGMAAAAAQDAAVAAVAAARTAAGGAAAVLRRMPGADTGELTRRDRLMMENTGLTPLTAGDLAEAAGVLLRAGHTDAAVALVDARRYAEACRAQTPRGFLDLLDRAPEGPAAPQDGPEEPAGQAPLAARLLALSPQLRADALLAQVLRTVTEVLGEASDGGVDPERGFFELGMDSVMAVALKVRLDEQLGVDLPATLTFEFPTARALARHLLDGLTAAGEPEPDAQHAADAADAAEAAEAADTGAPDGGDDLDSLTDDELMERLMAGLAASEQILGEG